jgi:hypothetical protein
MQFGTARRPALSEDGEPVIVMTRDLPGYGINYNLNHLRRMWKSGAFPAPRRASANRLCWPRSAILAWIAERTKETGA